MKHWLLVYDRSTQTLSRCEEFTDGVEAIHERFKVERERRGEPGLEVVVIGGRTLEGLMRSHSRYFVNGMP